MEESELQWLRSDSRCGEGKVGRGPRIRPGQSAATAREQRVYLGELEYSTIREAEMLGLTSHGLEEPQSGGAGQPRCSPTSSKPHMGQIAVGDRRASPRGHPGGKCKEYATAQHCNTGCSTSEAESKPCNKRLGVPSHKQGISESMALQIGRMYDPFYRCGVIQNAAHSMGCKLAGEEEGEGEMRWKNFSVSFIESYQGGTEMTA